MTILDSLGSQVAAVKAGEDPQLKLAPDAEALALFAGLFAMLQPHKETGAPEGAAGRALGDSAPSPDGQMIPAAIHKSTSVALPAAARLMLERTPATDTPPDQTGTAETASLAQLLIAAKSLSEDADLPPVSGVPAAPDVETETATDLTTAKAILARAIEILDDIDSGPVEMAAAPAKPPLAVPTLIDPTDAGKPAVNDVGPTLHDAVLGIDSSVSAPVTRVMTVPGPSEDFVGPMPAAPVPVSSQRTMPAQLVTQPAPSADFVGPMPATPVPVTSLTTMPAQLVTQPAPSADFVGPMPAAPVPVTSLTTMPAQLVTQPAPSADFVGPMPLHPVPLAGHGGSGQVQPVPGQPGIWHSGIDGLAKGESLPAVKGGLDPKLATGIDMDQIRMRRHMVGPDGPRAVPGTTGSKVDPASMSSVTVRELRAHADQATLAAGQSSAGNGPSGASSSGQSSSGTSASAQTIAATGGQAGGQSGGQHQPGQGGGQSTSQGFADAAAASRDQADRTMLHRLNTANAGWSETMIKRLTSDLRSGVQTVRIILEPRHLGRLNVDLGLRNGKASIRIAAETAEAAKLLGSARGQLGQMLEQSGMRLASFQTSASGQDAAMDGGGGQQGYAQSDANGKNSGRDQGFSNKLNSADGNTRQVDDSLDEQDVAPRAGETAVLSVLA